jgi:hypothetical protein
MIKELKLLEKQYLELFTGYSVTDTIKESYTVRPNKADSGKQIELFRFSTDKGFSTSKDSKSIPVILSITPSDNTTQVESFYAAQTELVKQNKGLVYRIPEKAQVSISMENKTMYSNSFIIPQFGTTTAIPEKVLKEKSITIEFNPKDGSLKGIK